MLSSQKNIEAMTNLASDVKDYVELKFEYAKIEAHKLSAVGAFIHIDSV